MIVRLLDAEIILFYFCEAALYIRQNYWRHLRRTDNGNPWGIALSLGVCSDCNCHVIKSGVLDDLSLIMFEHSQKIIEIDLIILEN